MGNGGVLGVVGLGVQLGDGFLGFLWLVIGCSTLRWDFHCLLSSELGFLTVAGYLLCISILVKRVLAKLDGLEYRSTACLGNKSMLCALKYPFT